MKNSNELLGIASLTVSRTTNKPKERSNIFVKTAEIYYKINIYCPFLDMYYGSYQADFFNITRKLETSRSYF